MGEGAEVVEWVGRSLLGRRLRDRDALNSTRLSRVLPSPFTPLVFTTSPMPPSPPHTPRTAHFLGIGRPRAPTVTPESEPLLDEPGPSRARSVSLAQSIASVASFVSAASSTGLSVSRSHSRNPSVSRPKSPRSDLDPQEDDELLDSDDDHRASLAFSDLEEDLEWDAEWDEAGSDEPLVRRRRRDDAPGDRSLWEVCPDPHRL